MQELNFNALLAFFCLLTTFQSEAQVAPPTIMPGLSGTYSTKLETAGMNARLYYAADHHFCFGPEISYFKKLIEDGEITLFETNVNLHYIVDLGKGLGVYPLGGINYSMETETENHSLVEEEHKEEAFGVNVGTGLHYATGRVLSF